MRLRSTSLLMVSAALLCAGCVATPSVGYVISHREPSADLSPRRVLVVSRLPIGTSAKLGPTLEKDLESRVQSQFAHCGVSATGYAVPKPVNADEVLVAKIREFQPDAVLLVDTNGSLHDQYGNILYTRYAFRLLQGSTTGDKADIVWNANAVFHPYGLGYVAKGPGRVPAAMYTGSMERYVDAVIAQMKADGFFPGCPADPIPSSTAPATGAAYAARSTLTAAGGLSLGAVVDLRKPDPVPEGWACSGIENCYGGAGAASRLNGPTVAEFAPNLAQYVGAALVAELRQMGIDTADARRRLDAEIEEARTDASGWAFGCHLTIRFQVKDVVTGKVLYADAKVASSPVGSIGTEVEAVNVALRRTADMLASDPEFEAAVR